jgi:hypothetical protein
MANQEVKYDSFVDINIYDKNGKLLCCEGNDLVCYEEDKFIYEEIVMTCDLCKTEFADDEMLICKNCNKHICLFCSQKKNCQNGKVSKLKYKFMSYFR